MDGGAVVLGKRGARRPERRAEQRAKRAAEEGDASGMAWLALMERRGRLTAAMLRAAVDIRRGQMTDPSASTGVRAVDPSRLVVDGGAVCLNLHPLELGGYSGALGGEARVRWEAYERAVRQRPGQEGLLRGRWGSVWLHVLLVKVVVEGERPNALDERYGVRQDRCRDAVLRELEAYAAFHHFGA
jgi:hypothetical protein